MKDILKIYIFFFFFFFLYFFPDIMNDVHP